MKWPNCARSYLAISLLALSLISTVNARIITVDDDGPADFNNIQAAIDDATDGDTVEVQPGTYTGPGNRSIQFFGKAITVTSTEPNDPAVVAATVVDCNGSPTEHRRGFYFRGYESQESVLDGMAIINAYADRGAAIYVNSSHPTIRNCIMIGNTATELGGGIYCWQSRSEIVNCTFKGNTAPTGGGMYNMGNVSRLLVDRCKFIENSSAADGGAVWNVDCSLTFNACVFTKNAAGRWGGGIGNYNASPVIANCVFTGNSAGLGGGVGNGTPHSSESPRITVVNCTFSMNTATDAGGGYHTETNRGSSTLTNCIFWDNSDTGGADESAQILGRYPETHSVAVNYCCILGWTGAMGGLGNIGSDPLFVEDVGPDGVAGTEDDNLRLSSVSPCLDIGDNSSVPEWLETDIVGMPRIVRGAVDMGAYEFLPSGTPVVEVTPGEFRFTASNVSVSPDARIAFIRNTGEGILNWSLESDCDWLQLNPPTGSSESIASEVVLTVDSNGLPQGQHTCVVEIVDPNTLAQPQSFEVIVDVQMPVIGANPTKFEFTCSLDNPYDGPETLALWNDSIGALNWEITEDCEWLQVLPASGQSLGEINEIALSADAAALSAGSYTCSLVISDPNALNSPRSVSMTLDVRPPTIVVAPSAVSFSCAYGGPNPDSQELQISNGDIGMLNWRINKDCSWLDVVPASGQSGGDINEVVLTVDASGLNAGDYSAQIIISDPNAANSPVTVPVSLYIGKPLIRFGQTPVRFDYTPGDPNPDPKEFYITNGDEGILNWQLVEDCNWLDVSPLSGWSSGEPNHVTVTVDPNGLPVGTQTYNLTVIDPNASNSPQYVTVTLKVRSPLIAATPTQIDFTCPKGGPNPEPQALSVWNSDIAVLNWEITEDCNWLQVTPATGRSTGDANEVLVSIDATGLDGGTHNCTLTISDPNALNSPQYISVNLDVQTSIIDLTPERLLFSYSDGGRGGPEPQVLSIWNAGIQTLNWRLAEDCNWVEVSPDSGQSSGNVNEVTVTINPDELSTEDETCLLTISDPNSLNKSMTVTVVAHKQGTPLLVPSIFPTIADAIEYAEDGDTVIVAPGTYTGYGNHPSFGGKAITVRGTDPEDFDVVAATVIDCNQQGRGFAFVSGEDANSILSGLTITNAYNPDRYYYGGGIGCEDSSPLITNCIITGNTGHGGGIGASGGSLTVKNCIIANNHSTGYGGGIYGTRLEFLTVENCIITGNTARRRGGGIRSSVGSRVIRNCLIAGNKAGESGGGIAWRYGDLIVENSTITGNVAGDFGGGLRGRQGTITEPITILNSIIYNNHAPLGAQIFLHEAWYVETISLSWCNLQGGQDAIYFDPNWTLDWGPGNIDADPCFADPGYWGHIADPNIHVEPNDPNATWVDGDYHLKSQYGRWDPNSKAWIHDDVTSLCIDAADPNLGWTAELWPNGWRVNLGVYGGTAEASMSPNDVGNIADLDLDLFVYNIDLKLFMGQWLLDGFFLPADFTRDGIVGSPDFAVFAQNWERPPLPAPAENPSPFNGALDISPTSLLGWTSDENTRGHDIYLGTEYPGQFQARQTATTFEPNTLENGTWYYWRIDTVNPAGITTGSVWSFRTGYPATNPDPPDGTLYVGSEPVLSWQRGEEAISHNIFFGTTNPPPFQANQTELAFEPGSLEGETLYYWRIDEVTFDGVTQGAVWNFTTQAIKGRGCFPADTLVWVDGEMVEISKVAAGAMVDKPALTPMTTDLHKTVCAHQIEDIDVHNEFDSWDRYDIVFENGNTLAVADSHYFLLDSGKWACVRKLTAGSKLSTLESSVTIKTIKKSASTGTVYNLKIRNSERYLVGKDGIIVRDW